MKKEKTICPICHKKITPPKCYWESVNACSACVSKAKKIIQDKFLLDFVTKGLVAVRIERKVLNKIHRLIKYAIKMGKGRPKLNEKIEKDEQKNWKRKN